jgi:hypothetical protein
MHLEYCISGPDEIARSREYDALEIGMNEDNGVVYISGLNRKREMWYEIAEIRPGNVIRSTERGRKNILDRPPRRFGEQEQVYTIFIDSGD